MLATINPLTNHSTGFPFESLLDSEQTKVRNIIPENDVVTYLIRTHRPLPFSSTKSEVL